jgi:hypothetical protein
MKAILSIREKIIFFYRFKTTFISFYLHAFIFKFLFLYRADIYYSIVVLLCMFSFL